MRVDSPATPDHAVRLLGWYDTHARVLPWRSVSGTPPPAPYRVWLSEIMLQQTTVASVKGYFDLFTTRWPTVAALAAATDSEIMQAWAGLGYYARARNLLACARAVMTDFGGEFPTTEVELRTLPGIGGYTAAAIAAIAFGRHATVVDGNVERVVSRLFAVTAALPSAKAQLNALAAQLTPVTRCGDYAQAMMDLGATICTPRAPDCGVCPISSNCLARQGGMPAAFPVKAPRKRRPTRLGTVYWLVAGDAVLLAQRPPHGLLGGMWGLPSDEWGLRRPDQAPPLRAAWSVLPGVVRHVFTHFDLELLVMAAALPWRAALDIPADCSWVALAEVERIGLPTVFAKAARHAFDHFPDRIVAVKADEEAA